MIAWQVWDHTHYLDTVFFTPECDEAYIVDSLVRHDGFCPSISIVRDST